jgi:hypothetical protein
MDTNTSLMEKFITDRKRLKSYSSLKYESRAPRPYLFMDHPEVLAGFAGYLKFQCLKKDPKTKVFCRGQVNDYPSIPSLFRGKDLSDGHLKRRLAAYDALVCKAKNLYNASRFQQENIHAIFQHYGLKTTWLDLVDNVFVALWFATHKYFGEKNGNKAHYKISRKQFGHIYFYATTPKTKYFDLREEHSSLSLRLHVQHGISITRKETKWTLANRCLDDHLVATVKFPNGKEWRPSGQIFSTRFLFPSTDLDNTYKYLKMKKFSELLSEIGDRYQLGEGELGRVADFG